MEFFLSISFLIISGNIASLTADEYVVSRSNDYQEELQSEEFSIPDNQIQPAPNFGNNPLHTSFTMMSVSLNDPPGEMGQPVVIANPTEQQKVLIAKGYSRNAFNEYASDLISIERSLPDYRSSWCKKPGLYLPEDKLLPTSVIICFHDEAWSVLLRTIHSILNRTPSTLLREIILVDDFSEYEHLKEKLDLYIKPLKKVKLIRAQKREGLIRARMLGASYAEGPVLTFFDSHVEVTEGWYQPMADRITKNWGTVVVPVIDSIHDDTFEYMKGERSVTVVGGFNWDLQFQWIIASDDLLRKLKTPADPVPTPTMAGGLFSIHRKFWEFVGQYDAGYEIWGAENLELSFKTWMCGGILEISPCSHVGHVYRKRSPYAHKTNNPLTLYRNLARLAVVWLDDYAPYFFTRLGGMKVDYGNVTERIKLKNNLQCKSFQWYLENIYPSGFNPKLAVADGEVRNEGFGGNFCLDAKSLRAGGLKTPVYTWPCHMQGGNQFWFYTQIGELRRDDLCLDYTGGSELKMHLCHNRQGNQLWMYDNESGLIVHVLAQLCLTMDERYTVSMEKCEERITQRWNFERYNGTNALLSRRRKL